MKATPPVVYKYMSFDIAAKTLAGMRLRATPPNDFNDPFEMMPGPYIGVTDEAVYKCAEQKCYSQKYYELVRAKKPGFQSYEQYKMYMADNPCLIKKVADDIKHSLKNRDFSKLVNEVSAIQGVLCFSSDNDNILMWSHYADNHRGVVIGFDSAALSSKWFPVDYQDERVGIPFGKSGQDLDYIIAVTKVLSTKHTQWTYENEFRFYAEIKKCAKENVQGNEMYFFQLPNDCIKEVILGARMSDENKSALSSQFQGKVLEAQMDLREFRVRMVERPTGHQSQ